ncbi:flagellar motor protein MotB [Pelagibius litoralis]|uniref:Flagellar motor protein MotB n=1 Tax=Pelagibius litoralis TaxID=374515 RepID=A0A967EUD9_9PROT|nr:flagellar motor protein MotB [Pelagibius litoralis]NIA67011.1 flagellar motor protein MotB [Pelagibius litoralis]
MAAGANDAERPIIIIKKVKKGGGGHHGGAWKVAYADFVTAMMAFFLLLWLLNATTEEQKRGIAEYFTPVTAFAPESVSQSTSGSNGVLGGQTMTSEGSLSNDTSPVGVTVSLPGASQEKDDDSKDPVEDPTEGSKPGQRQNMAENPGGSPQSVDPTEVDRLAQELEQERFDAAEAELQQAIAAVPDLADFAKNLVVDQTPEGLRIQIIDQEGKSMFASGSASMYPHTQRLLALVTNAIDQLDNPVAIKGHTDATPYSSDNGYSNWELSTDRANSSRRALIAAGLPASRIASVVGRADQEHFIKEDPFSPRNRRISIVLLRQAPVGNEPVYESDG